MQSIEYTQKSLELIAHTALDSIIKSGRYGFNYSTQVWAYLKNKYYEAVRYYADHRNATWEEFHDDWMATKLELGWKYEPKIDNNKKISKHIFPSRFLCGSEKEEYAEMRRVILLLLQQHEKGEKLDIS